jgi:lipopolysaccharide transport system permease protein
MIAGGRKGYEDGAPDSMEHRPEGLRLTIVKPASGWLSIDWAEIFAHRDLLFFLVWRDLKVRYQQTILGATWAILQPLLTVGIFSLVFGRLASMPSDGLPYPLFCFTGLVIWNFFMHGVVNATSSVVASQQLVQKVYFPRLVIPLATVLAGLVDFAITFVFLLVVMLAYGVVPGPYILVAVPLLGVTLAAALGVGSMLAAFNVRFRDVRHITGVLSQIWLFATPIVYPASLVPEQWRALTAINPMVGMVEGFRWAILRTGDFPWDLIAISTVSALFLLMMGLLVFRRMESSFADVI